MRLQAKGDAHMPHMIFGSSAPAAKKKAVAASVVSHWSKLAHRDAPKEAASLRSLIRASSGIFSRKEKEDDKKKLEPQATIHVFDKNLHISLAT